MVQCVAVVGDENKNYLREPSEPNMKHQASDLIWKKVARQMAAHECVCACVVIPLWQTGLIQFISHSAAY